MSQINREYRLRKIGRIVRVQRVKGLMQVDSFSFDAELATVRAWCIRYEAWAGNGKPIILSDPYLEESRIVQMLKV